MKKSITVFMSIVALISTMFICCQSVFAETTSKYWEPRTNCQDSLGCINGEPGDGVNIVYNKSTDTYTVSYDGKGKLVGWEFPTLEENTDYEVISENGNSITIKKLAFTDTIPYLNALVEFSETTSTIQKDINENKTSKQANPSTTTDNIESTNTTNSNKNDITITASTNNIPSEKTELIESNTKSNNSIYICIGVGAIICIAAIIIFKKKKL